MAYDAVGRADGVALKFLALRSIASPPSRCRPISTLHASMGVRTRCYIGSILRSSAHQRPDNRLLPPRGDRCRPSTSLLTTARVAAEGFRLSTIELGIRIVAPRSLVVS